MRDFFSAVIGKTVRQIARLRGGGSALPGLVVERIDPGFMARALGRLPYGVVAVSGTNGKTTTTKMIVEMLEAQGLRVFTNKTGSNFSRGVVAAMLQTCSIRGRLPADIAILELDEAHAMYFIDRVKPRTTLLLNVLRDQLDRFGEIDTTAALLQRIADATSESLIVNREDRLVAQIGAHTRDRAVSGLPRVAAFGLSDDLLALFPGDDDLHSGVVLPAAGTRMNTDVTLIEVGDHEALFEMDGKTYRTTLQLEGLYNTFNAAAALCTVRMILQNGIVNGADTEIDMGSTTTSEPGSDRQADTSSATHAPDAVSQSGAAKIDSSNAALMRALAQVRPAFGRGEKLILDGQPLELVLVKNPAGFRLALTSVAAADVSTMIAINDQYADGRDMSWLWDIDFESLTTTGVAVVSGARAWDMALRLEHDDVPVGAVVEDLHAALEEFRQRTPDQPRRIFCTYTAMLTLRARLGQLTDVEDIW